MACDYWSLGVLAYEITIGNTPFSGQNTTATYSKIMNFSTNLKFRPDVVLSQAYISLIKGLLVEARTRMGYEKIIKHPLFKNVDFNSLRDQIPPFVPKIASVDDVSNFSDIQPKKNQPSIENFKAKSKFSGKDLPFIGFTHTRDFEDSKDNFSLNNSMKDSVVQHLKGEIENLQKKLLKSQDSNQESENLERKLEEKSRKLESVENVRDRLERDLAGSMSECSVGLSQC